VRPYLPLVMGLAILAATVGAARGHSPSATPPVASRAVEAAPAVEGGPAAALAASGAAQEVAAPETPAVPDRIAFPPAVFQVQQAIHAGSATTRQLMAAPPVAVRPGPARGATGRRAPPRSA